ncbi:hypothetical protein GE09DRAFT_1078754 [Coniochaeta sp. 2T2.1]|nr:hypothetical protein GE09DRAFT_1078754 [Coniochaeta sp. 2T2.1]
MAEGPTRRACNRCHAQKLSCKRTGEEACERCVRLKTECKSSLSLRFRRNRLSLEKSPQRGGEKKPQSSKGVRQRPRRDFGPRPGLGAAASPSANSAGTALVAFDGADLIVDAVGFSPYSALHGNHFTSEPNTGTVPQHTIPRDFSDPDLPVLDAAAWSPSYQASGYQTSNLCGDWSQHPSSSSSYDSSPSHYHYTTTPFPCLDPQQLRFDEQTDQLFEAERIEAPQAQRRPPRQILLRRSSVRRMATQGKWLAQLSDINSTLWNLSSQVPYLVETGEETDVYACESSSDASDSQTTSPSSVAEGFPIQSMFEASGHLVQVLGEITQTAEGTADVRQAELDPGTGLLVLSTYVRLLDLYQKVFQLVHSEVAVSSSATGTRPTFRLCKLPDVSIGSFPVASAISLQMALTMRLAEDFLSSLRQATALFSQRLPDFATRGQQGGGQASLWSVVDVSFTAIREREQDVSRYLGEIRGKLEMSSAS